MPNWILLVVLSSGAIASLAASTHSIGAPTVGEVDLREGLHESPGRLAGKTTPRRILSASLLSDELLLALHLEERLVGVSYVVDWPDSTPISGKVPERIPRTSGKTEDVLAKSPDLVVFSAYNNALTYAQLRNLGLRLFTLKTPQNFEQLFREWQRLGDAVGRGQAAGQQVLASKQELSKIQALVPNARRPKALLLQGLFSYGPETLQGDALRQAGFENVLSDIRGPLSPQLNTEQVLSLDPEYLFVASTTPRPRPARPEDVSHFDQLRHLAALEAGKAYAIPGSWMASISQHALLASRAYADCRNSSLGPAERKPHRP